MWWLLPTAWADPTDESLVRPAPLEQFGAALERMQAAVASVRDATFDLHQQEYVGGKLRAEVVMHVWYRPANRVYVEWDDGQRLLWLPGENNGKMRVDPGSFIPTLSLAPDSALATRGQRHTVRRMGLAPVAALFAADTARVRADPERLQPTVTVVGPETLYGRPARCFDALTKKDLEPSLYGVRVEVCLDAERWYPLRMRTWDLEDGEVRMVEMYGYDNLQVNVGLPDSRFDAEALGL